MRAAGATVAAVALTAGGGTAAASSLPSVSSGHRPGPDILYAPPPRAPQLENTGVWRAPPILVSGSSAYRDGEFLWQSWLFDDHGAEGHPLDGAIVGGATNSELFAYASGTYHYPTDPAYAGDAADLVEFRVKPLGGATAFRLTFNTMKDPSLVGTTIALDGRAGQPVSWPYAAAVKAPADFFLTVHGSAADLRRADGSIVDANVPVAVDTVRRQIEVDLPHADWDPTGRVVRMAGGVGLWDRANGRYLTPVAFNPTATSPGGAGTLTNPPAFFKVLFRYEHATDPATGAPAANQEPVPTETPQGVTVHPAFWRDSAQAQALAAGDLSAFHADVDFRKLAAGVSDDMPGQSQGVPQSGPMDRIYASHVETKQGRDESTTCSSATSCQGELRSQLQPYAVYIPRTPPPRSGYGLTLLLHSLTANYNQFLGTRNQSQFGDRSTGSIVITPEGRGPDGWYYDEAAADTFEVWADVAARYHLDPAYTAVSGYSMGGYGTYKFATQFPDLFAAAQPVVGPPALVAWFPPEPVSSDNTYNQLESLRNVPILIWNGSNDELVPIAGPIAQANRLDALGYRYELDVFVPADHLAIALNDQYQPAADFLGSARVDPDPPHVTYTYNPSMDFPADGTAAGHAYWASQMAVRDRSANGGLGTIDVFSHGFGVSDPAVTDTQRGADALTGGTLPALPYSRQYRQWAAPARAAASDVLDITATNTSAITIDAPRARVDCRALLNVHSDGPVRVTLAGCGTAAFARGGGRARVTRRRLVLSIAYARRHRAGGCGAATATVSGRAAAPIRRVEFFATGRRVARVAHRPWRHRVPRRRRTYTLRARVLLRGRPAVALRHAVRRCAPARPRFTG